MSYFDKVITLQKYLKYIDIYLPQEIVKTIIDKTFYKYTRNITMFIYNLDDMGDGIRDGEDIIVSEKKYKIDFDDRYELRDKLLSMANEIYNNNICINPKFMLCMREHAKIVVMDKGVNDTMRIINHLFLEDYLTSAKNIIRINYYPYNNKILSHIN